MNWTMSLLFCSLFIFYFFPSPFIASRILLHITVMVSFTAIFTMFMWEIWCLVGNLSVWLHVGPQGDGGV